MPASSTVFRFHLSTQISDYLEREADSLESLLVSGEVGNCFCFQVFDNLCTFLCIIDFYLDETELGEG